MGKVGVMMSADRADGPISSHFGKAEWIMVSSAKRDDSEFVKNGALNGKGVVGIVILHGCTDVILADIGDGALAHLQAANIRAWAAPEPVAGSKALQMFREGQLLLVPPARKAIRHDIQHG